MVIFLKTLFQIWKKEMWPPLQKHVSEKGKNLHANGWNNMYGYIVQGFSKEITL